MDADLIKEYEAYLLEDCGLNLNTVSFYMRNLRAIYNRAVEKKLTESRNLLNMFILECERPSSVQYLLKLFKE